MMERTYTVTMSIEGGQLGEEHEEITASDDDAAIEAAGFAARELVKDRGWDQSDALVAVYLEVWAGERLINQDTIEA